MFTGLIEAIGTVADLTPTAVGYRIQLRSALARELSVGESLAVNGVCLTVTMADADTLYADISPETARVTTLGTLARGRVVNLERPMRADARFGGHFVQGHIDATGTLDGIRHDDEFHWMSIAYPAFLRPCMVHRGSIAVDGVSMTVAGLGDRLFDVQIIPYTWEQTNYHDLRLHEAVNLECDILGKYVARALEVAGSRE